MSDVKEIEARAEKARKALEVGGMAGAFLCVQSICDDIPHLLTLLRASEAENKRLREALVDMLGGWIYIRQNHGDLYGVGWDRCEESAKAALNPEVKP